MNKETKQKTLKALGIVGNVLIWLFVAFSVLTTVLVFTAQGNADGVPDIFGKSLISIQSDSMKPVYKRGDLVFMEKLSDEEKHNLKEGDIITYHVPVDVGSLQRGSLNTHRVVSNIDYKIVTKGDNEVSNDGYELVYSDIVGICTEKGKIAGVGGMIDFLGSSLGFFLCIVLPLILFFLYEMYNFISLIVSERAKRAPVSKETEEEIKKRAIEEYLKSQGAAPSDASVDREASKEESSPEINEENK